MKSLISFLFIFSILFTFSCSDPMQTKEAAQEKVENSDTPPVTELQSERELDEPAIPEPEDYSPEEEGWGKEEKSEDVGWGDEAFGDEDDWGEPEPVMEEPEKVRSAKLAFYCPKEMTFKQTSDVIGFIAELIDEPLIEEMMERRLEDQVEDQEVDLSEKDMLIRELQLYNLIELRLDDADNEGFTIKKVHEDKIQEVTENMEGWHWKVTPTTTDIKQQLVLKVIVYKDDMSRVTSFDKTYFVKVKIESKRFFRNTYALFVENPEWAFASVIAPIFTFFVGRIKGRRKEKKKKKKKSSV